MLTRVGEQFGDMINNRHDTLFFLIFSFSDLRTDLPCLVTDTSVIDLGNKLQGIMLRTVFGKIVKEVDLKYYMLTHVRKKEIVYTFLTVNVFCLDCAGHITSCYKFFLPLR